MGRIQSRNNFKNLAIAASDSAAAHDYLLPADLSDKQGRMLHSWSTQLLPYLGFRPLYDQIQLDVPWDAESNREPFTQTVMTFQDPRTSSESTSHTKHGLATTHYSGNSHLFTPQQQWRFRDITDGTSQTLLFGEITTHLPAWGAPYNARDPALGLNRTPAGFNSPSAGIVQFALADGSVRTISENISPEILRALATPANRDDLGDAEW